MLDIKNPRIKQPILGRWDLKYKIGNGKHGEVYYAEDSEGLVAAVKIISLPNDDIIKTGMEMPDPIGDDQVKMENFVGQIAQKFGNEVESMRVLNKSSENIIRLYDNYAQQNGICWDIIIVMEYATPLKEYFKGKPLRIRDVINFAMDIASGLTECEKRHIIHRDIKDDNLFIGINSGVGKIGDFGVASINENGLGSTVGMGTPYYMAPEVMLNKYYDNTVDIYSLGIVLYKMLNGNRFPLVPEEWDSRELAKAFERRRNGEPLPYPQYAQNELGNIVVKCCEHNPQKRFRSGAALYNALIYVAENMSENELNKTVPYISKKKYYPPIDSTPYIKPYDKPGDISSGSHGSGVADEPDNTAGSTTKETKPDWFMSTISIIQSIIRKEGRNSKIAEGFGAIVAGVDEEKYRQQREEYKKKQKMRTIIIISACVILLGALLVLLYPKTATFYIDASDDYRIHVKYMFLPDRRKADIAASYLNVEGNWLYFSNPDEDHNMYKLSIWGGKPKLLCEDDCEYDVLIDGYIYYTHYDDGEKLYRIKTDGTGRQCILDYRCRDLRRNGKNIMFKLVDTGELKELDTTTIE